MKNKEKETQHSSPSPSPSPAEVAAARREQVRQSVRRRRLGGRKGRRVSFLRSRDSSVSRLWAKRLGFGKRRKEVAQGPGGGKRYTPCAGLDPIGDPWHPSEERRLRPNRAMVSKRERGPGGFLPRGAREPGARQLHDRDACRGGAGFGRQRPEP